LAISAFVLPETRHFEDLALAIGQSIIRLGLGHATEHVEHAPRDLGIDG
jgi:hypothetical protein